MITNPNQKILFIPEARPTEEGVDTEVYWRPSYNNLGNKINGVVIKKGWDNLTIAAAMNNMAMFTMLLKHDVDTTLCSKVIPTLKHRDSGTFKIVLDNHIRQRDQNIDGTQF